jgi:hypothetical protein
MDSTNTVSSDGLTSYIPVRMLQQGLQSNDPDIEKIYLGQNTRVDPRAIITIASALHKNTHLLELCLSRIHVSTKESVAIASMLERNKTIENMELHDTNIGDVGVVAIAKALETNTTLTQLVLDSNAIGLIGALALATGIQKTSQ